MQLGPPVTSGAGSRIAVIDTGTDTDHQSFSAAGFDYSCKKQAEQAGENRGGLQSAGYGGDCQCAEPAPCEQRRDGKSAVPQHQASFGYNYVDKDLDITHDRDQQGEHGSHVAGISTANACIPNADGTFSNALDTVKVQGVAPTPSSLP